MIKNRAKFIGAFKGMYFKFHFENDTWVHDGFIMMLKMNLNDSREG